MRVYKWTGVAFGWNISRNASENHKNVIEGSLAFFFCFSFILFFSSRRENETKRSGWWNRSDIMQNGNYGSTSRLRRGFRFFFSPSPLFTRWKRGGGVKIYFMTPPVFSHSLSSLRLLSKKNNKRKNKLNWDPKRGFSCFLLLFSRPSVFIYIFVHVYVFTMEKRAYISSSPIEI